MNPNPNQAPNQFTESNSTEPQPSVENPQVSQNNTTNNKSKYLWIIVASGVTLVLILVAYLFYVQPVENNLNESDVELTAEATDQVGFDTTQQTLPNMSAQEFQQLLIDNCVLVGSTFDTSGNVYVISRDILPFTLPESIMELDNMVGVKTPEMGDNLVSCGGVFSKCARNFS